MSQDTKGRTMIGTVAPVVPRSVPPGASNPATSPPGTPQPTSPSGASHPIPPSGPHPTSPPGAAYPASPPGVPYPTNPPGASYATNPPGAPYPTSPPGASYATNPPGAPYATNPPGAPYPIGPPSSQHPAVPIGPQQPTIAASPGSQAAHLMPTRVPTGSGPVPTAMGPMGIVTHGPTAPMTTPPVSATTGSAMNLAVAAQMIVPGDADIFVGQELCGYLIRRKLAEGGMGVVYEGQHAKIGRLGAIKVLKLEFCRSEEVVERFYQEARAVNSIRHENIVDIYDFGRDPYGRVYFVMEYLEGEPLSARLRRGALGWPEAFTILEQTLRALKAAHDKGFVHRDLKPDNIWLKYVDGRIQVKLLDFGIAKLVGTDSPREKLTQTGSVIGTPHYMSPEQINGSRSVDHRTDIYALGVITYEMFAGVTPFNGDTLQAVMTGHLFQEPPRLADLPANLGVPGPIAEIVDRMLVKDATGRYANAADVLSDLHDVNRNQRPANAETLNRTRPARKTTQVAGPVAAPPVGKKRTGAVAAGVGAVVIAVAGIAIWKAQQGEPVAAVATPPAPASVDNKPAPPVEKPIDADAVRKEAQITLRASLRETEPAVRKDGSDTLGRIKDQPSVAPMTEMTQNDPDADVRGHTADALGVIGAVDKAPLLKQLEAAAPPPLKVWYASALARLGDRGAAKRLLDYARSKDLAVSFKAGLTLADVSRPGDKNAIKAIRDIAAHEAELNAVVPYAGAMLLTKLVALRDPKAREVLYAILAHTDEGARLAAAEGLAKLGDDAGKKVLQDVLANPSSPNRLVAAVAQIPLGEYGGLELITTELGAKEPGTRRLAARALGDIAERKSLPALLALTSDKDWTVRIAAAGAIIAIVGLDPQVLAQASVDWTKSALDSQDWAVRKAAAGVLADIPDEKAAVPLLAQAIVDPDSKVRLAASKSAGKMKSAEAAAKVVAAVAAETDPGVKEQQVKALGEIGRPEAREMLAQISEEPGRIGVFAAGSLVAVGDTSAKVKLEAAVAAPQVEMRLAAVQAASSTHNDVMVPTLKIGLVDRVFDVKFAAAEGLAGYMSEKVDAIPVLTAALESKNADVVGRAMAALTKLGEAITKAAQTPAEMLESTDPKQRLAAVPVVRAMGPAEGVPLLRRLVADPDQEVRRAGVDAIEDLVPKDRAQAIKLYKPLVSDEDPVIRSKASGQLARLVDDPQKTAAAAAAPPPPPAPVAPPPLDPKVKLAYDEAVAASAEATATTTAIEALTAEVIKTTAIRTPDDATFAHLAEVTKDLEAAPGKLDEAAAKVDKLSGDVDAAAKASPSPDASKLVDEAKALAKTARDAAVAMTAKATDATKAAREYKDREADGVSELLTKAEAAIAVGNTSNAKRLLDKAAALVRTSGGKNPNLDYLYGALYDRMFEDSTDPAVRPKLRKQAEAAYNDFLKGGTGPRVQRVKNRLKELPEEP